MRHGKSYALIALVVLLSVTVHGCRKKESKGDESGDITFPVESYIVDHTSSEITVEYMSEAADVAITAMPSWCRLKSMEPGSAVIAVERNDGERRSGSILFDAGGGGAEFMIVQRGKAISGNGMIRVDSVVSVGREGAVVVLSAIYDGSSVTPSVKEGAGWIHAGATSYATLSQLSFTIDENPQDAPRRGVILFTSDAGDTDSTVIWQAGKEEVYIEGQITLNNYLNTHIDLEIRTGTLSAGETIEAVGLYMSESNPYPGPGDMSEIFQYTVDANNIYLNFGIMLHRVVIPGKRYNVRYALITDRATYYSDAYVLSVPAAAPVSEPELKIPIIFHVYYSRSGSVVENVDAEVLYNQLDMANFIWRGRFGQGVDTKVEFVPATHTPWGEKLSEPGIHRVAVSKPLAFSDVEFVNNAFFNDSFNLWDPKRYVNVWLMNITMDDIAGYATLPFMPMSNPLAGLEMGDYYFTHPLDYMHGIVLDNEYVSSLAGLTTLAHEAGHLFGLLHAFSENGCQQDDHCADVPNYDRTLYLNTIEQSGAMDVSRISCQGESFMSVNVMDYFYGQSFAISSDQKKRIDHTLDHGIVGVNRTDAARAASYVDADAPKPNIAIIH